MSDLDSPEALLFASAVGDVLRDLRGARGWTIDTFARHVNLSSTITCRQETGARPITMARLYTLSAALEISPAEITAYAQQRAHITNAPAIPIAPALVITPEVVVLKSHRNADH